MFSEQLQLEKYYRLLDRVRKIILLLQRTLEGNQELKKRILELESQDHSAEIERKILGLEDEIRRLKKENKVLKEKERIIKTKIERLSVKLDQIEL